MACRGSGVQIPSAPLTIMNISFIKEILSQTKELVLSQFFIALVSLLQVSLVVKILGVENYGIVTLMVTLPTLVFRALHSKNSDVTLVSIKQDSLVGYSYLFDLLIGFFAFLICMITLNLPFSSYFGIETLDSYIVVFLASRIIQTFSESSKAWLIKQGKLRKFSILESLSVGIRFLAIVVLISNSPTVENYILGQTIYSTFYGTASILLVRKSLKINEFNFKGFKNYLKSIYPIFRDIRFNQIIGIIPQHFDVIVVSIISDYSAVGIYRFAKRLIEPINYIISIFNPWLQSKLSHEHTFPIQSFLKKFLFPLIVTVTVFYVVLGRTVIKLIGSEEFISSYEPMLILLLGYICYLLTFWIRQYLLFNKLIKFHTYGKILYSFTFILLSFLLGSSYGFNGIALSLSISMILQKIFEYVIYKNKLAQ